MDRQGQSLCPCIYFHLQAWNPFDSRLKLFLVSLLNWTTAKQTRTSKIPIPMVTLFATNDKKMVTGLVFRALSIIWQCFQLPTGQINTKIRHCGGVQLIGAITPLSLGPLVHGFCRGMAKQSSYLPVHIHNVQLHSPASHRSVAQGRGAGHDLQHQDHPPLCSEQRGSQPLSVRSEALQANRDRYGNALPPTMDATQTPLPVLTVILLQQHELRISKW